MTELPPSQEAARAVSEAARRLVGLAGDPSVSAVVRMKPGTPVPWSIQYGFEATDARGLVLELFEASRDAQAWFRTPSWALSYRKLPDGREPLDVAPCRSVLELVRRSVEKLDASAPESQALLAAVERHRSTATTTASPVAEVADPRMRMLVLNMTTTCNARCPFCIVGDSLNRPELNMTDEQIFGSLRKAREEGAFEVGYSGGEPTVHPKLVEFVAYAKSLGYRHQSINTNGILLKNADRCRSLVAAGLSSIDISIHGHTDALHDREVARPGALAAIREACGHLRKLKGEYEFHLSATTVITNQNHMHMKEICEFLESLGIEHKRLKYAYEGTRNAQAVINEVAPYQEVVPSVQDALSYLAEGRWGFDLTHIPLCLLGEHAVFSADYKRIAALMVFRKEAQFGDPGHFMRRHASECESCVLRHQCTRLDRAYVEFHGRAPLKPFNSEAEVEALFERALQRWPKRRDVIGNARDNWRRNHDASDPASTAVPLPVVAPSANKPR